MPVPLLGTGVDNALWPGAACAGSVLATIAEGAPAAETGFFRTAAQRWEKASQLRENVAGVDHCRGAGEDIIEPWNGSPERVRACCGAGGCRYGVRSGWSLR